MNHKNYPYPGSMWPLFKKNPLLFKKRNQTIICNPHLETHSRLRQASIYLTQEDHVKDKKGERYCTGSQQRLTAPQHSDTVLPQSRASTSG